jgi:putative cell wall-binding protein/photosystem II stability/assembly factor-like uncharacterized protein
LSIRGKHRIATALVVALVAGLVPFAAPARAEAVTVATPSATMRSVSMIDASTAVAVATNGTIWRSTNAGNSWESVRVADAYDFRAVDFWNTTKGVAVDLQGKVAQTADGGVTWTDVDFSPYADMDHITAPKNHHGLACIPGTTDAAISVGGDPDTSDDSWVGGVAMRTWGQISYWRQAEFQAAPHWFDVTGLGDYQWVGEGEFFDVDFVNGTLGWAVGKDVFYPTAPIPLVYRTTNTGGAWTALTLGYPATLNAVAFGSTTAGVVAGQLAADGTPRAYYTTNGGTSWSQGTLPAGTGIPRALHMTSATNGWLSGDGGTLLRTTDGGQTWTACTKPAGFSSALYDIELVGTVGIAVGASAVLTTTDGITWYRPDLTPPSVPSVSSSSHPVATTWYATRAVAATFSATDASGIAGYAVVLDQSATTIPDAVATQAGATYTATLASDGEWYLHVRAVDTRGNWSGTQHRLFRADTAAPVTTSDAAGPYTGSATITLTPTDPSPGSGVASTRWSLDGGGSGTGTTVNVSAEGDWTLRFSSADVAGNREETRTATFAVEIAPAAPVIASATHPDADAWYGDTDFEASWTASDTSGIAGYAVVLDQSASTVPVAAVTQTGTTYATTIPADGEWYLHVRAVDTRGNWGETAHRRVRVDSALPTVSAIASATHPVASTWYASRPFSASWSASDTSGIAGYAVVLDQSALTVPAESMTQAGSTYATTLASDGEWYLHVRAVDSQGDWSGTQHRLVRADTAPPVTTSNAAGPYAGSATITLTPTDPAPGSGVASTHWSLDGGGSGTGTTVNVTAEGDWTLRYYSADVAGNVETGKTASFAVEIAPGVPAIASASHPVPTTWYATRAVAATIAASDSSGIAGYAVVLDQSPATVPDATVTQTGSAYTGTAAADGVWYLHARAVDTRGNWSTATHRELRIDTAPPVTTSNAAGPYAGSATITLSPSDPAPGSGVASTHWSLDGGGSGTGTTVNVTAEGDWTLRYYSADVAGNVETGKTATFAVEIAPGAPAIASATHPNQTTTYPDGSFSASWTASDTSGIAGYAVAFDASASTVPAQAVTQTGATFAQTVPSGTTRYLHVRAVDTRGNWGPASHFKVTVGGLTATAVAGADRIATAIAAAKVAFPSGAGTVVIATARNWPDALGGAALAGAVDGPILLTEPTALPSTVAQAISELGASKAIILGGTAAVSSGVQSALGTALGGAGNVTRIDGADRYETARKVAAETVKRLGTFSGTAFIATGANFPDALAASPLAAAKGWPIYLVRPTGVDDALVTAMKAAGVNKVIILGGTGAVPASVESALKTRVPGAYTRLQGTDRYATALAVATYGVSSAGLSWNKVAIATGENFPDALAGGVLQGRAGSVMVLTPSASLYEGVRLALTANKAAIWEIRFLGGLSAVGQSVRDAAIAAVK